MDIVKAIGFIRASSNDLLVVLYGSSKSAIENATSATIVGVPDNFVISPGSVARTKDWEVGTFDSDGTWHWS